MKELSVSMSNQKNILLSVENVFLSYKRHHSIFRRNDKFDVLKGINFCISSGESVGVIGRNGAGKSTLLSLLAGIIAPDSGKVVNFGAKISLLSLGAGFFRQLSGRDNIMLSGLALGFSKQLINEKMDEIIDYSGVEPQIDMPVRTYSTGMIARLGFSVANMLKPDILLVDEVLGVGDKEFREKSTQAMKEKIMSDQAVVLVSHSVSTIMELCSRAIWIENGQLVTDGPVANVMDDYSNSLSSVSEQER